jgi:hypothetical protein
VWSKRFGDNSAPSKLALDGADGILLAGHFEDDIDFGGGVLHNGSSSDVFAAKLTATADHVWSQSFGDVHRQEATDVVLDGDGNVVLAGCFTGTIDFGGGVLTAAGDPNQSAAGSDIFVVKLDASGSHLWSQRFGDDTYQCAGRIAVDSTGNVIVAGAFAGVVDFGIGSHASAAGASYYNPDGFVVKFDPDGVALWSLAFGDVGRDTPAGIAVDGSDNVILAGWFGGTVDLGGGPLTSSGDAGATPIDVLVAKLAPDGTHLWSARYGDDDNQYATRVDVGSDDSIVVAGTYLGSLDLGSGPLVSSAGLDPYGDVFLAKLDANGESVWSRGFGDAAMQTAQGLTISPTGEIWVTGGFTGSVDFGGGPLVCTGSCDGIGGMDIFLAGFSASGQHVSSAAFGDDAYQVGVDVAIDSSGGVVLASLVAESVDFGCGTLTGTYHSNVALAAFSP